MERIVKNRAKNLEQGAKTVKVVSNINNNIKFSIYHNEQTDKHSINTHVKHHPVTNLPMEVVINGKITLQNHEKFAFTEVDEDLWNEIAKQYATHPFLVKDANGNAQIFAVKGVGAVFNNAIDRIKDLPRNITDPLTEDVRKELYKEKASELV